MNDALAEQLQATERKAADLRAALAHEQETLQREVLKLQAAERAIEAVQALLDVELRRQATLE